MILGVALVCAAVLLALAVLAALVARSPYASRLIYAACMFVSAASLAAALTYLLFARVPEGLTLPVGLPWLPAFAESVVARAARALGGELKIGNGPESSSENVRC